MEGQNSLDGTEVSFSSENQKRWIAHLISCRFGSGFGSRKKRKIFDVRGGKRGKEVDRCFICKGGGGDVSRHGGCFP